MKAVVRGAIGRGQGWLTDACRGRWGKVDRKEGGQWKEEGCCRGRRGGWTGRSGAMGRGYFCDGMPGWTYFYRATPGHIAREMEMGRRGKGVGVGGR